MNWDIQRGILFATGYGKVSFTIRRVKDQHDLDLRLGVKFNLKTTHTESADCFINE